MKKVITTLSILLLLGACQSMSYYVGKAPITLSPQVQHGLNEFLKEGRGAWAFAVSTDGRYYGYTYCKSGNACAGYPNAQYSAISYCEGNNPKPCKLYAINGKVVWQFDEPTPKTSNLAWRDSPQYSALSDTQKKGFEDYIAKVTNPPFTSGVFAVSKSKDAFWQTLRVAETSLRESMAAAILTCNIKGGVEDCYIIAIKDKIVAEKN